MLLRGKAEVGFDFLDILKEVSTEIRHLDFLILSIVETDTSYPERVKFFFWREISC